MLAFLAGVRTVLLAPQVLLTTYVATLAVVLPMTAIIAGALPSLIQATPMADPAARLFPLVVWESLARQTSGLAATFTPVILGLAAPLVNIGGILERRAPAPEIAWAALGYAVVWQPLWGGVIAAFARGWIGWRDFFRSGLRALGPILLLTVSAAIVYAALFLVIHPMLLPIRHDDGRAPEALVALRMLLFGTLLMLVNVFVDLARIRLVLDGESRMGGAVSATVRLIRTHTGAVMALTVLNVLPPAAVFGGYAAFEFLTRGVPSLAWAIGIGLLYIVARLAARLMTTASQVCLVQRLEEPHR